MLLGNIGEVKDYFRRIYWSRLEAWKLILSKVLFGFEQYKVRSQQKTSLKKNYSQDAHNVIFFLCTGEDIVNGGIMSICSLYKESQKLKNIHGSEVVLCTVPGKPAFLRYTKFENSIELYSFHDAIQYFRKASKVLIHVPEVFVPRFVDYSKCNDFLLRKIDEVKLNVMLQNIDLLDFNQLPALNDIGVVTCTTAHDAYTTDEIKAKLGCPLHKFSVFISPEQYKHKEYFSKEDLMIVSPDLHPEKGIIIESLVQEFPHMTIVEIKGYTYEEYKELISRAKWSLTFGEGLDGYFIEPIFSGGISFSVYNDRFFTAEFSELKTVYSSYDDMKSTMALDIRKFDNEESFHVYGNKQYELCAKYYCYDNYKSNILAYYLKFFSI